MADVPHFALPFRFHRGRAVEVEQDSTDDVAACVEAVLLTRPGERDALPDFGSPDFTFSPRPVPAESIAAAVERWEPRVHLLAEEEPDRFSATTSRVRLTTTQEG
jgi:phage baseplate assembly protein W